MYTASVSGIVTTKYTQMYGEAMLSLFRKGHWNIVMEKNDCDSTLAQRMESADAILTATAVPGRNVSVRTATVFMAALSCRVSSAIWAVAAAISKFSRLSRLDSSAIVLLVSAIWMLSLLSLWMM